MTIRSGDSTQGVPFIQVNGREEAEGSKQPEDDQVSGTGQSMPEQDASSTAAPSASRRDSLTVPQSNDGALFSARQAEQSEVGSLGIGEIH